MSNRPSTVRETVHRVVSHARHANLAFTAAGIAYYVQISLLPGALLAMGALSAIAGERIALSVIDAASGALSPTGERLLEDALTSSTGRIEASIAGGLLLLWSGIRLFRGLSRAVAEIYDADGGVAIRFKDSAVALGAVAAAVFVLVGASIAGASAGLAVPPALFSLALTAALAMTLYPLYYILPNVDVGPLEPVPGAVVTAGGWVVLRTGFGVYLDVAGRYAIYGVLGAMVLLVTWLYVASILLVLGVVLNVVLAGRDSGPGRHTRCGDDD